MNLGIACSPYTCAVVQLFESNYIAFERSPTVISDALQVSGRALPPFSFSGLSVWYEQAPHPLTLGQLDMTSCGILSDIPPRS